MGQMGTFALFIFCFLVVILPVTLASLPNPLPAPALPRQSEVQVKVLARAASQAIGASLDKQNSEQLSALLSSPVTRGYLAELLSAEDAYLAQLPTEQLLQKLRDALAVAEIVHNFDSSGEGNCGLDVDLFSGMYNNPPYFFNQWMLQVLDYVPVDGANNYFTEASETTYFGFPPFPNVSQPTWSTAASRPVYAAINLYRNSAGNAQCGPIAAVFSRRYIADQYIAAPIDTGLFYGMCGQNQTTGWMGFYCHAWPASGGPLGVEGLLDHLFLPFLSFYNATAAIVGTDNYVQFNMARLITRLLSRSTYTLPKEALRLNLMEGTWGYFETNPVVTMNYPDSIKMLVGAFEVLFGTERGKMLQAWCVEKGWVLAWAHNPEESMWNCGVDPNSCTPPRWEDAHGTELASVRVLDPEVLRLVSSGKNCTSGELFDQERADFRQRWDDVFATVPANATTIVRRALMDQQWQSFSGTLGSSSLAVEPLFPGACASDLCSAVRIVDGTCVCPP